MKIDFFNNLLYVFSKLIKIINLIKYIPKYLNNNIICVEWTNNYTECDQNTSKCLKCDDEFILQEGKCFSYSFVAKYFLLI